MKSRRKVSKKYSKKIFRKTATPKKGNVRRPMQRGGWRM